MLKSKKFLLPFVLAAVAGAIWYLQATKPNAPVSAPEGASLVPTPVVPSAGDAAGVSTSSSKNFASTAKSQAERIKEKGRLYPPAVELVSPSGFINAEKFSLCDLAEKKVILVDFWTYSCINCLREIPYIEGWYEKYRDQGLVIVGVHTPEFEFEHDYGNVSAAVKKIGITYPVVLDNDKGTWNAYHNQYWPRLYLIDIDGFIVYDKIGEGSYGETELRIQKALLERAQALAPQTKISGGTTEIQTNDDPSKIGSRETYFGAARNEYLVNGAQGAVGVQKLETPANIALNALYLTGTWDIQKEFAENKSADAKIIFRYSAKNVYLVGSAAGPVDIKITRDGKPLGAAAGADAQKTGAVRVEADRLYKLIEDPAGYGEHTFEITIPKPGLRVFTLTFG